MDLILFRKNESIVIEGLSLDVFSNDSEEFEIMMQIVQVQKHLSKHFMDI